MTEQIRIASPSGDILARNNWVVAFFGCRPFAEMSLAALGLIERWLQIVPAESLRWALIGMNATKYKKTDRNTLSKCAAMLQVEVSSTVDTYFEVLGPAAYGPDFMVMVNGYAKPRKLGFADQTNVIQFVFPVEYCDAFGVDRFVELVSTMFATLPCDSGYAAPGLVWDLPDNYDGAEGVIAPLALQHHGYDVSDNASTAVLIGAKCRGARWLTMLSTELVDRVGGSDRLRGQLDAGVEVCECARGLTIRAGATPELGHVNRGEGTPLLASVARAIEPVTFFGDNAILPLFGRDIDRRDRWERRFWWNQR